MQINKKMSSIVFKYFNNTFASIFDRGD